MSAELSSVTLGYDQLQYADLVDRELKGSSVTIQEYEYLNQSKHLWRAELVCYKKRTEMQFTSSKARMFSFYSDYQQNILSYNEYLSKVNQEKTWRCNAARFLQQVESKIQKLKAS